MVRRGIFLLVLLAICSMIAGSLVTAQPSTNLLSLSAGVTSDGKVALKWSRPLGDSVRYYLVYRGSLLLATGNPVASAYVRIDSTTGNDFTDAPASNVIPPIYSYYVEARMKAGATLRSNSVTVMIMPRVDVVRITSEPVKSGKVGVLYSYQVKAVSSDSTAKLRYELSLRPDGMTVDSTGLIKWTPQKKGTFTAQISVTSTKGGRASQLFSIAVTGPSGTIAGTVTDTTGKPIAGVTVRLYGRDKTTPFEYDAVTDALGKYTISKIDFGTYIARAVPMKGDYLEQWYDGATTQDKAKSIEVKDSTVVSVNFKLKSKTTIPIFTVSGTVLDSTGKPIKDATVAIATSSFGFNSAKADPADWSKDDDDRDLFDQGQMRSFALGVPGGLATTGSMVAGLDSNNLLDFRMDGNSVYVFKTKVDSLGKYSVRLPQGSYVAQAEASGYYRLFYNNRSDFLSADIIKVQADVPNISFVLKPILPIAFGKIIGSVVDSVSGAGVISRVIAYRLLVAGKDTVKAPRAFMVETDSLGAYSLTDLPPGDYIVLAIPLGHYVPAYYSAARVTREWKNATKVTVNGNTVTGITVYVLPMVNSSKGYTSIGGNVNSSRGTSNSFGKRGTTVGIEGSLVYAVDNSSGQVGGYGITNTDGSFTIAELAPGSYTVSVDKVDYSPTSMTASPTYDAVTGAALPSTVSLSIDATVTDVATDPVVPTNYTLDQNYPNPFNPSTQIPFSLPQNEKVTLTIYNIIGQKIATLVDGTLAAGTHVVTWNGRDSRGMTLSSGVYFYMLKTSSFTATKRMTLLK
jgi:hypothetical protein